MMGPREHRFAAKLCLPVLLLFAYKRKKLASRTLFVNRRGWGGHCKQCGFSSYWWSMWGHSHCSILTFLHLGTKTNQQRCPPRPPHPPPPSSLPMAPSIEDSGHGWTIGHHVRSYTQVWQPGFPVLWLFGESNLSSIPVILQVSCKFWLLCHLSKWRLSWASPAIMPGGLQQWFWC